MRIVVLKETQADERRVALVPESVKKLIGLKAEVAVEAGAGAGSAYFDDAYRAAGATVEADRSKLLSTADVLAAVNTPPAEAFATLKEGAVLIAFLRALDAPAELKPGLGKKLTGFAMELVPRTTRAQSMDALSSMATVAGYKAVLMAADRVNRMFPMLMTAAGTVPPARVLVLGAGVAGLMAIATAKRLGAQVEGYDVRKAAGEQVRSLGASFLEVDLGGIETEDAGGYAKELTPEALERGKQLVAKHARNADVVITTAQIPGKAAPILMEEEAVTGMKPGAIIVDLAGATGGNTTLTRHGEIVDHNGVTIMSPANITALLAADASQLYSRNVTSFLSLLIEKDGALQVNLEDDILGPSCVMHEGRINNQRVADALAKAEKTS